MKWQRFVLVGCSGMFFVCMALPFIPYFWRVGQASQAQQRWTQNGTSRYTIIVLNSCCPSTGRIRLTVEFGAVTDAEPIDWPISAMPPDPTYFNFMTVEAMLGKAGSSVRRSWDVPWFSALNVEYDPVYGYVTYYTSNTTGWLATFMRHASATPYYYTASDLEFIDQ